jgi:hypothetical protein
MNALHIDRVKVRYRKNGRSAFGFLIFDDFESDNVLCFDAGEATCPRPSGASSSSAGRSTASTPSTCWNAASRTATRPTSTASRWTLRNWPQSWPRPATTENLRMLCQNPASTFADDAAFRWAARSR